jgi:hypothetical protein
MSFNTHRVYKPFHKHPYSSSSNKLYIYLRSEGRGRRKNNHNHKMREWERSELSRTPWGTTPPTTKPYRPLIKSCLHLTVGICGHHTLVTTSKIPRSNCCGFHQFDLTVFIRCLYPPFVAILCCYSSIHCCHLLILWCSMLLLIFVAAILYFLLLFCILCL